MNCYSRWRKALKLSLFPALSLTITATVLLTGKPVPAGPLSETILFAKASKIQRYAIYSMRPDGKEAKLLVDIPVDCREPNLCAANNTLAFSALIGNNWHVYTANLNTNEVRHLAGGRTDARHPVWFPDGSKIVFETDTWGQSELAVIDVASAQIQRLTFNQCINRYPAISPDGNKVAYTSWMNGTANIFELTFDTAYLARPEAWSNAWKTDSLIKKRHQLTKGHRPCTRPSWNRNSQQVAFECLDQRTSFIATNSADKDANKTMRQLCVNAHNPAWSPDGKYILYSFAHKKTQTLKLYDTESATLSDFPRQFTSPVCDLVWQRRPLPWSINEALQESASL
ncbi:PD40 domain-containing protein [bacterium]|nr:PD40 domain-containing protein [bacterium]